MPIALKKQALLRAVAQVALVVLPAPGHALAQAQFFQQVLHLARVVAGHGQVVRAQRAGDAAHRARAAVAAGTVLQLQQRKVVHPGQPQRARRRQPRHAATRDDHPRAAHHRGFWQRAGLKQVAQRMAALHVDAGKAALQRARRLIAPGQHHGGGRRGCGGGEKVAAQHGVSASGEMNLRLRTRTARAAAVETSRGASTSSA